MGEEAALWKRPLWGRGCSGEEAALGKRLLWGRGRCGVEAALGQPLGDGGTAQVACAAWHGQVLLQLSTRRAETPDAVRGSGTLPSPPEDVHLPLTHRQATALLSHIHTHKIGRAHV